MILESFHLIQIWRCKRIQVENCQIRQSQFWVTFESFSEEVLCPVACLDVYLKRTEPFRDSSRSRLFLTHIGKHEPVSKDTIRRWLKDLLGLAGINTTLYKGHSVRAASSSNDHRKGAMIKEILRKGGWSRESTWQNFYRKDIEWLVLWRMKFFGETASFLVFGQSLRLETEFSSNQIPFFASFSRVL